jgi:hypothetical protein
MDSRSYCMAYHAKPGPRSLGEPEGTIWDCLAVSNLSSMHAGDRRRPAGLSPPPDSGSSCQQSSHPLKAPRMSPHPKHSQAATHFCDNTALVRLRQYPLPPHSCAGSQSARTPRAFQLLTYRYSGRSRDQWRRPRFHPLPSGLEYNPEISVSAPISRRDQAGPSYF